MAQERLQLVTVYTQVLWEEGGGTTPPRDGARPWPQLFTATWLQQLYLCVFPPLLQGRK